MQRKLVEGKPATILSKSERLKLAKAATVAHDMHALAGGDPKAAALALAIADIIGGEATDVVTENGDGTAQG